MGAPTSNRNRNRKRTGFPFRVRYSWSSPCLDSASQLHLHVPKKRKPSFPLFNSPMPSQTTLNRVLQYPKPQSLKRRVHAPCRSFNFTNPALSCFSYPRFQHRNTLNLDRKEKVIVVDHCLADSGVGEVEILSFEGSSLVSDRSKKSTEAGKEVEILSSKSFEGSSVVSDRSKKSAEAGKMLGFFPNNRTVERFKEPPHRQLYEPTRKPASSLSFFAAQIEFLIKKFSFFGLSTKKPEKGLVKEAFVELELTNSEEEEVSQAFSDSNRCKVLVTHRDSNIEITGKVLQCLRPGAWLNDEVINLYLELLKEREKREPEKFLKCHFFNTFFYSKLIRGKGGYDFKAVKRWTTQRKIGYSLIECDKIFVPVHKDTHWCLAVINRKDEKFQYLDSLQGKDLTVLEVLARYYVDEVKDKSAKDIDVSTWKVECVSDLPEQKNGFDCGVFMIKYADFYSQGLRLNFDQKHMPYFRKRTAKEILRLKAE